MTEAKNRGVDEADIMKHTRHIGLYDRTSGWWNRNATASMKLKSRATKFAAGQFTYRQSNEFGSCMMGQNGAVSETSRLEAWFLHERLVLDLVDSNTARTLTQLGAPTDGWERGVRAHHFEMALSNYLDTAEVASLDVEHMQGRLDAGRLVWFEQAIPFKGISAAVTKAESGGHGLASFNARLSTDTTCRVKGTYNASRITSSSSLDQLSGTKPQYVLGYTESVSPTEIEVRPIVIARRWLGPTANDDIRMADPNHVWATEIDQFAGVDFGERLDKSALEVLRSVSEERVKLAFAEILGEPTVPKDWGGEEFDLWSGKVSVKGEAAWTAIAFKGPAKFHPMVIGDLGKNGDQINRLAQTAADLLVVQHCHAITAPVINMLKAYVNDQRHVRRYMTIDGYDTIRILRHFNHI